ncbi:MAG: ABC transporter substrate-binding protein, partial [Clostridia bacterium]|nr:ABC transporter substrate-binding protein [Clostridia bacterium]
MKKLLAVLLILAMVLAMSTCAIAEGDKVIKLGVLFPYTGSAAAVAEDAQKGIEFAISEINDRGGIQSMGGAKIELYYGDTQSNEEAAATEAERLITNIGVSALMGCYQSAITA